MSQAATDAFVLAVGDVAMRHGWVVLKVAERDGRMAIMFEPNPSQYGALDSKARAKSKVAIVTDMIGRRYEEAVRNVGGD